MNAIEVFKQQDGKITKSYYATLDAKGPAGQIATALFRAQKRSTAAKRYRGRRFRSEAYSVKSWSMDELCRLLTLHGTALGIRWGWKEDWETVFGENCSYVLYVDIPFGQVSFHSPQRGIGPDYRGEWDKSKESLSRTLAFCDGVFHDQLILKP